MNVKIEDLSSVRKKLSIEVGAEQVDKALESAYEQVAKGAKVKGFRKGKVPRRLVEQYYAPQMQEKAFSRLINDHYFKALTDNDIAAIGNPNITDGGLVVAGEAFAFTAEVEVKPEIDPKDYTGLGLKKEKLVLEDSVIDQRLEELQSSRAELKVSEKDEAADGDHLTIDFAGFKDGEPFQGGSAEGHVLELGSNSFIPGFEEQLVGMKRGEEKEVNVTFPEDYGNKELAGQPAVFKVTLHEIKQRVVPELDDEFAKGFGADSFDELKQQLTDNLRQQEENRIDGDLRERLVAALVERNPVEVPEAMIAQQLEGMLNNVRGRMQQQGLSLEMLGMTEEKFYQDYRDAAISQVQGGLVLEAIAKKEDLKVEDGEIDEKLAKVAEMANAPLDAVKNYYASPENRSNLISQIIEEKTLELLFDSASIDVVDAKELAPAAGENEAGDDKE